MSRCISLIATCRSSVGSNARYTLDIPPEPTFSSSRKRSPIRVPITVIILRPLVPLVARYYTDPACPASWAVEPALRRLMMEFGDDLSITYVMGGLARSFDGDVLALILTWLEAADRSGMPVDPRLWSE